MHFRTSRQAPGALRNCLCLVMLSATLALTGCSPGSFHNNVEIASEPSAEDVFRDWRDGQKIAMRANASEFSFTMHSRAPYPHDDSHYEAFNAMPPCDGMTEDDLKSHLSSNWIRRDSNKYPLDNPEGNANNAKKAFKSNGIEITESKNVEGEYFVKGRTRLGTQITYVVSNNAESVDAESFRCYSEFNAEVPGR